MGERFYSIDEVARLKNCNRVYIWWMIKAGVIKAHRLGKKMWAIPESEIDKIDVKGRS